MYLSKVNVSSQTELLDDIYMSHKMITASVSKGDRYLYRVDGNDIYVQTHHQPRWSLPAQVKKFEPVLHYNVTYRFLLVANTCRRSHDDNRTFTWIRNENDRVQWLRDKASLNGIDVHDVSVRDLGIVRSKMKENLTICGCLFDGRMTVSNPEDAVSCWKNGFGRGKAFGCGLFTFAIPGIKRR